MAKKRAASKNSRASRRATSPSIDTDKSLKDILPPSRPALNRPNVLAVQRSAGIAKKQSKRKSQLSSKARRRHERGLQMAEAVEDRTRNKVEKSEDRNRTVKERRKNWEDINKEAEQAEEEGDVERKGMFGVLGDEGGGGGDEDGWETDEDMDAADQLGEHAPAEDTSIASRVVDHDLDEIL